MPPLRAPSAERRASRPRIRRLLLALGLGGALGGAGLIHRPPTGPSLGPRAEGPRTGAADVGARLGRAGQGPSVATQGPDTAPRGRPDAPGGSGGDPCTGWRQLRARARPWSPRGGPTETVAVGDTVVVVGNAALGDLRVDGVLLLDPGAGREQTLQARRLVVTGRLQAGDAGCPMQGHLVLVLDDPSALRDPPLGGTPASGSPTMADMPGMAGLPMAGPQTLAVLGGHLALWGERRESVAHLSRRTAAGETTVVLDGPSSWRAGDAVIVTGTGFGSDETEARTVVEVQGAGGRAVLSLDRPLAHPHWGTWVRAGTDSVDERAEVGLLTRGITIRGGDAGWARGVGAHVTVMAPGTAQLSGVAVVHGGSSGLLGRYPIHWHLVGEGSGRVAGSGPGPVLAGDALQAQFLEHSTVWGSANRCVVLHGVRGVTVSDNVCYDITGHAVFLEDGGETESVVTGNLVARVRSTTHGVLASDARAAAFWISHPRNRVDGNTATGAAVGFWYPLGERVQGLSGASGWAAEERPRAAPLGSFAFNVAHSNRESALLVDEGPGAGGRLEPVEWAPPRPAHFRHFTAYAQAERAVWVRGTPVVLDSLHLDENLVGLTLASTDAQVTGGVVAGTGRGLDIPGAPGVPVRGLEFYDGPVRVAGVQFSDFRPRADGARAFALGFKRHNPYALSPGSSVQGLRFSAAVPLWVEPETGGALGASRAFQDLDGSLGLGPGTLSVVTPLAGPDCRRVDAYNALWCAHALALLHVGAPGLAGRAVVVRGPLGAVQIVGAPEHDRASAAVAPGARYAIEGVPPGAEIRVARLGPGAWVDVAVGGAVRRLDATHSTWRLGTR